MITATQDICLAIVGGRDFTDYDLLCRAMFDHFYDWDASEASLDDWRVSEIISGGARGADSCGARWAKEHDVKLTEFIPDWDRFGKRAGFLRNEDIIAASTCVLGLWDGKSRGTANSLSIAKRLKKPTLIIYF